MLEKAPKINPSIDVLKDLENLTINTNYRGIINDYLYWDSVKYKSHTMSPEQFWSALKLYRIGISKPIEFGKYSFTFPMTDFIFKSLHNFDLHFGGHLGSNIGIAETDKNKFIISSLMEEAISSSQMEGANTTRKKAKEMIAQERRPINKSEQMIYNNYFTMNHISQHKTDFLSLESLLEIHRLIVKNTMDDKTEEGAFRKTNDIYVIDNTQNEIVHTPPDYKEIESLLSDVIRFFNQDSKDFIHPIIKGIIIHFMIGWIHPFSDGNGRTARALFYWYMLKKGYWLTEYLSISRIIKDTKVQYEKSFCYSEVDDNDLGYFITYNMKTMDKAMSALKEYITRKQKEVRQAALYLKIPNINERMAQILKLIHEDEDRILYGKEMEKRFGVTNVTARNDLNSLADLGFLERKFVTKQKITYIKSPLFHKKLNEFGIK